MSTPNLLFIFTDQQTASAMSCAGNTDLSTPAMDSLAAHGVRFTNACCTFPICTPSRGSMMTGLMPYQSGIIDNDTFFPDHLRPRQLGALLSAAGYDCGYGGKWHLSPGPLPEGFGFTRICTQDDTNLASAAIDFLNRPRTRPFLLVASFDNPHNICQWARGQALPWGPIPDVPTEQCPVLPANFPIPPYEPEVIRIAERSQPRFHCGQSFTPDEWRHYRHAYYRLVEKVDGEIGRILTELRRLRLEEDTVIVFSSDHGDGNASHQWNQKSVLYQESVGIPLIISHKGRSSPRTEPRLASNGLDLLPTFCDYANAAPPPGLPGRSLRPLVEGASIDSWRTDLVAQTTMGIGSQFQAHGRMLRTDRYKYIVYNWGRNREQLFDLQTDPGEMVNLARSARHHDILDDHRRRLHAWCHATGDKFAFVDDSCPRT